MVAGNVFAMVMVHWVRAILEVKTSRATDSSKGALLGSILAASLLNAGPWTLLVVGYFAFYISSKHWASSFFAGAGASIAFMTVLVAITMAKLKRAKPKNAA